MASRFRSDLPVKGLVLVTSYVLALAVVAVAAFLIVLILAGPHAGLLPMWLEAVVLACGWLALLIVPLIVTRGVWHRLRDRRTGPRAE